MNNLFIINSPLQYLNCVESINYFNTENNILIIKRVESKLNMLQVDNLHKNFGRSFTKTYYVNNQKGIITKYNISDKLSMILDLYKNKTNKVFSGNIKESLNNYIINSIKAKEIYYLDDGTKTIDEYKYLTRKKNYLNALKKLINLKTYANYYGNYFTSYFDLDWPTNVNIYPNQYDYLRNINQQKIVTNDCYFILSPIVEYGIITEKDFKEKIELVKQHYDNNIYFILHRYSDLDLMIKLIGVDKKLFLSFDNIIEVEMLNSNKIPSKIASFSSSALLNLKFIFNIDATSFKFERISSNNMTKFDVKELSRLYDLILKKNGVQIIDI